MAEDHHTSSLALAKDAALNDTHEDSKAIHDTSDAGSKTLSHVESGSEPDLTTIEHIYRYASHLLEKQERKNYYMGL
jgi:hypothetical protein